MKRSVVIVLGLTCLMGTVTLGQGTVSGSPGPAGPRQPVEDEFEGWQNHRLEHNLVLPQLAVGGNIRTSLLLHNLVSPHRQPWLASVDGVTLGKVLFFARDGQPLQVQINGITSTEFPFRLRPAEMILLQISRDGPVTSGWALIEVADSRNSSDDPGESDNSGSRQEVFRGKRILATAYFTITGDDGSVRSRVAVLPALYERRHFHHSIIPAQVKPEINTGVSVVNTGNSAVKVEFVLRAANGEFVKSRTISLAGGHQIARFIREFFPDGGFDVEFLGVLEIHSENEGIVTLGLLLTNGILTSLPSHHFGRWVD